MMVINSLKALVPSEEFKKGMEKVQVGALVTAWAPIAG